MHLEFCLFSFCAWNVHIYLTSAKCTSLDRSTGEGPGSPGAKAAFTRWASESLCLGPADSLSVELILSNQNTKQGLGFAVGYRVIDLKTLGNILAGIVGFASTAVPILFSLRPSTVEISTGEACGLTTTEITTIQSLMSRNETCSYNMTLNEILGM